MLKGFRDFVMRGNIVDVGVGFVIGVAFNTLVQSFTHAFLEPLIKLFLGGGVQAGSFTVRGVTFDVTLFLNGLISFVITAAVLYFLVVLPMNKFRERFMAPEEPAATELSVLTEIRDELRARR